jgi:nucleotide-binding universal stress UspA family protein
MAATTVEERVRHVLVPLDGTSTAERALPFALSIHERAEATVELLGLDDEPLGHATRAQLDRVESQLAGAVATADLVAPRDAVTDLIRRVTDSPGSFVVMSGPGPSRSSGVFTDSAAAELLAAGVPVVVIGPHVRGAAVDSPVVACLDGSLSSHAVLPAAPLWASRLRVPLILVTVVRPALEPPAGPVAEASPATVLRDAIAAVRAQWPELDVRGRVVSYPWRIADALDLHLERHPGQLVAVATHIRSGFRRLVSPSIAAQLVHELRAPVLLVPIDETGNAAPAVHGDGTTRPTSPPPTPPRAFGEVIVAVEPRLGHLDDCAATARELAGAAGATVSFVSAGAARDVVETTVAAAAAAPDSIVCISAHTRAHLKEGVVHTPMGRIMRWSPRPVVVGAHCRHPVTPFTEVVACVDGSLVSEAVGELAARWAGALRIPVRVLEVVDPTTVPAGATPPAASYVARLATRLGTRHGISASGETLVAGRAATAICDWAETHPGALLVMAPHGRGLSERVLGGVVLDVARRALTPVVLATRAMSHESILTG